MQRELDWAKGRQDEYVLAETIALAAASSGRLQAAREAYRQAVEIAQRGKFVEVAADIQAREAAIEADFGNQKAGREDAMAALSSSRTRSTLGLAGIALSIAGDSRESNALADELVREYPSHTLINSVYVPLMRAALEVDHGSASKAIELLQKASPYEFGYATALEPGYVRGRAYLRLHQGKEAAQEFQKVLDHQGVCTLDLPLCSLAHLQLGRAYAMSGDTGQARTAYQDFFALWKDADADIPILQEAKAEYGKLQ
jgi:tetratricopeptide (TPR) repeat protein